MNDILRKLILKKYPNFDFNRYRYNPGDLIRLDDGAVVVVKEGALEYVDAYVYRHSLKYRYYNLVRIQYEELPYYVKGEFTTEVYKLNKTLKWRVGNIVQDPTYGAIGYLFEEVGQQRFYMFVLEADNPYYVHTGIYLENPYKDYVVPSYG